MNPYEILDARLVSSIFAELGFSRLSNTLQLITPHMQCRIIYLVGQLRRGGLERQLCYLLQAMDRDRYKPAVVVWNESGDIGYANHIRSLGIPLYCFAGDTTRWAKLTALRSLTRKLSPEVVHSYSFHTNFAAWWCTRRSQTIPIGSIRNNFIGEQRSMGKVLGRLSARWPAVQICNSWAAKKIVDECESRFKPRQLHVVPNRLDLTGFRVCGSSPHKRTLLSVGSLKREKRWDRLINIIALAASKGMTCTVRLAGQGPLLQVLKSQAKSLGVLGMIQFLGARDDILELLADSAFLLHTADDEGCPNVVMEAMASGRAVVSTDAGDIPLLVDDGKTGFVVRRGNDETLTDRVIQLVRDPTLCLEMGRNGRLKAEREFGVHSLISETIGAYKAAGWEG